MNLFTIDVNVNFPGVLPILQNFLNNQGKIMALIDDVKASQATMAEHVDALIASENAALVTLSVIVDALRALQVGGPGLSAADAQLIIDANAAVVAKADAAKAAADAAAAVTP